MIGGRGPHRRRKSCSAWSPASGGQHERYYDERARREQQHQGVSAPFRQFARRNGFERVRHERILSQSEPSAY